MKQAQSSRHQPRSLEKNAAEFSIPNDPQLLIRFPEFCIQITTGQLKGYRILKQPTNCRNLLS
jgi:hypothetical protein